MAEIFDHKGLPVKHGRARVNGIRMHYVTAGQGEPLLLLHGTPKTNYYWHKLIPYLTDHFTVVAPDLRGFGYTDKPPVSEGYDSRTNATDLAELMSYLGHETFHVHGEDRGAEFAYVLAATQRERVKTLSFCEMLLSGEGLEEASFFNLENITAQFLRGRFALRGRACRGASIGFARTATREQLPVWRRHVGQPPPDLLSGCCRR